MSIRLAFLDPTIYVSVNVEGKQPVKVNNIYAAILLMRMVLGENMTSRPDETFLSINRNDIYRLFKKENYHATSILRTTLGANTTEAEYRIFVEDRDKKKDRVSYRLEFGNRKPTIDVINLFNLLRQADQSEWNSTQIWQTIQHWNEDYSMDFISKLQRKSKVEEEDLAALDCVVWAKEQCGYLQRTLSAIFDKYVLCLIAENQLEEAERFVKDEWLGKLDLIYSRIDVRDPIHDIRVWPYFRMIQILYWQTQDRVEEYYHNREAQFKESMADPNVLAALVRHIQKNGLDRPSRLTDPRWLIPSENFDPEASEWIKENHLLKYLKNRPPHLQVSERSGRLIPSLVNYKSSQSISIPSLVDSERKILLETIENAIGRYFGDTGSRKAQRLQKRLDLDCQLTASETLTSYEVRNRLVKNRWDRLLILGEPGSGKSYLLYEIAEELLKVARASPGAKVPLPLSLATWDSKYDSFASWVKDTMMRELTSYKEAADWVDEGRVILLLDGLNEIPPKKRDACIAALEKYLRTERDSVAQCVITCRQQEYWEGSAFDIRFYQITVKPLTEEQIDYFLSQKGSEYESLLKDHPLRELCRTPLILTMVLESLDSILQEESYIPSDLDLDQIYDLVCEDRLRKIADESRKRELIRIGLMALAAKTKRAGLPLFTGEKFDRKWLDSDFQRRLLGWINKLLIVLCSLLSLRVTWFVGQGMYHDGGVNAQYLAEFTAVGVWIGGWWLAIAGTSKLLEREGIVRVLVNSTWNFKKVGWREKHLLWAAGWGLVSSFIGTAVAGGVFALLTTLVPSQHLVNGGLAIGISSLTMAGSLLVMEHWRKPDLKLIGWLLMGLIAGIGYGVLVAVVASLLRIDQDFSDYSILGTAIACGMATGFCVASIRGLMQVMYESSTIRSFETLVEQPISQLAQNILWFASKVASIVSLTGILLTLITIEMVKLTGAHPAITAWEVPLPIVVFFIAMFCFGLGSLVFYGGLEIVEHYLARFFLYREENGLLRNLDYLLNIAAQMDILRKEGRLYKFRHDTIRDYFARGGWQR